MCTCLSVTSGTAQPTSMTPTAPGTVSTRTMTMDTTVVTLMAILSALMAGLEPPPTAKLVCSFPNVFYNYYLPYNTLFVSNLP